MINMIGCLEIALKRVQLKDLSFRSEARNPKDLCKLETAEMTNNRSHMNEPNESEGFECL
ncbi:MAG: hypothetical protein ACM3U1_01025 [Chloroflexota bacterium]